MSTREEIEQDARLDAWYDRNARDCPKCGMQDGLICMERYVATRIDPGCELWQCKCGHEEEWASDG